MNESVIERFAATPEGREHLEREEARLNAELAAVSELRAAAVAWWRGLKDDTTDDDAAEQEDNLVEAAGRLAELEEQCRSAT